MRFSLHAKPNVPGNNMYEAAKLTELWKCEARFLCVCDKIKQALTAKLLPVWMTKYQD